jgi:serine protease Do
VESIDPLGPAAKSGLEVGDVITSVDGHDVQGENLYVADLLRAPPGTKLIIGVARGATVSITVAPRKRPSQD